MAWARLPGPQKVLAAARRRLQAGHGLAGSPLRADLTPSEREEVGRLLGIAWVQSGRAVGARALAAAVGSLGADVAELLAATGEPVRDLRADRAASRQGALIERERAAKALADAGIPAGSAAAWLSRRGLPAAGGGQLLDLAERCARVWRCLPAGNGGRVLLTVLAASSLDDPHALDRGSPAATGILRLLGHEFPDSAEAWRLAWEEHGVDCDPVSSRVLVLNLRMHGDAACVRLAEAAGPEPVWLTWRSLNGTFRTDDTDVFVCENPSVLIAAADTLSERSLPLVCTNGRPSAAAMRLLTGLARCGATLHVRADDDAAGQEIVSGLQSVIRGVGLWRFAIRPPQSPRYEEQDLDALLHDLDRTKLAGVRSHLRGDAASLTVTQQLPASQLPRHSRRYNSRRRKFGLYSKGWRIKSVVFQDDPVIPPLPGDLIADSASDAWAIWYYDTPYPYVGHRTRGAWRDATMPNSLTPGLPFARRRNAWRGGHA